ncbi:S-adenosyl-L-methionine-dependent methyltransferase [Chaetomium sp. MPI-SDFR-AT-0129]|nr:S-adenosyl-L-methionine-dependent methyltransferase [Chaetomium sp. MPI-SDFR-AT-0129]
MDTPGRDSTEPLIKPDPVLKTYYDSFESRIGYKLVLGGRRHFGYYEKDTLWPFPVTKSLKAMEEVLFSKLNLPKGSKVLDAGCGAGLVAINMAEHGLNMTAIDVIDHHVDKTKRNIARAGVPPGKIDVRRMDYHHLDSIPDDSHDGVYTMETFVHSHDPVGVLAGFFRLLRPGGKVAMFEYDHTVGAGKDISTGKDISKTAETDLRLINKWSSMPANERSLRGTFAGMMEEVGFVDVKVVDLSAHVRPMVRLFFVLAFVPYLFVKLLGLERWFINTVAGARLWLEQEHWRYVVITGTKPGPPIENEKTR